MRIETATAARLDPPFRAEHIGSFVRPASVLEAVHELQANRITPEALQQIQDDAIRDVVAFQESLGLRSISDGEFRRRAWSMGFIEAVSGFGTRQGNLGFRNEQGAYVTAPSPYAKERLKRTRGIATDEFRFLKSVVKRGTPKITVPSPAVMHFFLGPQAVDQAVYPDMDLYFDDLAKIYRAEIAELAQLGCTYLQLDDTALPCNCDADVRRRVGQRGEDPDRLTRDYARLINGALAGRPAAMTVGIHLCRGNLKGAWMAEGGYEPIADTLFNQIDVDAYFLEYDTPRAGDFTPLRHLPKNKIVVLGLVSTKTPKLESKDEIKRRIGQAAKYVDLDRLCLSPQCGFSSGSGGGQVVTMDDTKRKLELILGVASEIWR